MKYIVWKVTEENFTEKAQFDQLGEAELWAWFWNGFTHDTATYVVTPEGQTPVW